jgi:hypothetical protein
VYSFFFAKSLSFSVVSVLTIHQFSKANFLFNQGAMFFAIIKASIAIVQLQQNGSKKGSLNFQEDNKTKDEAKLSFKGASEASFLYPLICKASQEVLSKILALLSINKMSISIFSKYLSSK